MMKGATEMSLATRIKIVTNKRNTLKNALETDDKKFIAKWHGGRRYAESDLAELESKLDLLMKEVELT